MEIIVFILGFLYLHFDMTLLKKRAQPVFAEVFRFTVHEIILWGVFLLTSMLLFYYEAKADVILAVVLLAISGIYFIKRRQFLKTIASHPEFAQSGDEKLDLAISTLSILGTWFLGVLVIQIIVTGIYEIINQPYDELGPLLLVSELSSIILIMLIYSAVRSYKTFNFSDVMGLETKGLGFVKTWLFPAGFALVYAIVASKILLSRPVQPMTPLQEMVDTTSSVSLLMMFVGAAILTAPFFEEIIFRGFFFYVIKPFKGAVFAVLFVALSFGLMHVEQYWGDWHAIAIVGLFGLSLTLMRLWTGSSVPGMISHYVYNTCLTIIPALAIIFANPIYLDYQLNYYRLTNFQREERLLQSIEKYPEFAAAYNDLAWIYAEEGIKLERALELADQALISEPDSYAFSDTKAEVLFKMGRKEEAVAIEQGLLEKYPNDDYLKKQVEKFKSVKPPHFKNLRSPEPSLAPEPDPDASRLKIY